MGSCTAQNLHSLLPLDKSLCIHRVQVVSSGAYESLGLLHGYACQSHENGHPWQNVFHW